MNEKKSSLGKLHPKLASEWHPYKNGNLTAYDATEFSGKKVWWLCEMKHDFQMVISKRSKGRNCPKCSHQVPSAEHNLKVLNPEIASEWDYELNRGLKPEDFLPNSGRYANWICKKNKAHRWSAQIASRNRGVGCPFCSGHRVSPELSLATLYPKLSREWYYELNNGLTPLDVSPGSHLKPYWHCKKEPSHIWDAVIYSRVMGRGCPFCSNKAVSIDNNLGVKFPELAEQWHPTKNGTITPFDILLGSGTHRWWICPKKHEYEATPNKRTTLKQGCPFCSKHRVSDENRLSISKPDVAKMWHPTLNGELTADDVSVSSDKEVWWLCENDHSFFTEVKVATNSTRNGCKYCSGREATEENNIETAYPEVLKDWDWNKNSVKPNELLPKSNRKIFWKCDFGHSYKMKVCDKTKGNPCPHCYPKISRPEARIFCELMYLFSNVNKLRINRYELDIYIPSLSIGIEYDGLYYHKNRANEDRLKNRVFKEKGIDIIRVREHPLKKTSRYDIIIKSGRAIDKILIDGLLIKIGRLRKFDNDTLKKISLYLSKNCFQNEKDFLMQLKNYKLPPTGRSLSEKFPDVSNDWDYIKNFPKTPNMVYAHSGIKYWWKCQFEHSWLATVDHRSRGTGCPLCWKSKNT